LQTVNRTVTDTGCRTAEFARGLQDARWHLLRAETSCNFFWGDAWVNRCHRDLDWAWKRIAHHP
jgi:hypothetical protein